MRDAKVLIMPAFAALALAACGDKSPQQNAETNMAMDEGLPSGQVPDNADIEALPADESSVTPSNQLQNGIDSPPIDENASNAE